MKSLLHMQKRAGFTLIELLVAVGLFAVVMTIVSGAYIVTIKLNTRAQATALTVDNLSFVLENMTRKIRSGSNYSLINNEFKFRDSSGTNDISYTHIVPGGSAKGYIQETRDPVAAGPPTVSYALTDTEQINITDLDFVLTGAAADNLHPLLRIRASGTTQAESGNSFTFAVQTAVTMQDLE